MVVHSSWGAFVPPACREAALHYAQQGIPVFPVRGKIPYANTRGFYDATTDPDLIGWWWRRWPDANLAVPTGRASGWVAIDIDGRHGGFTSLTVLKALLSQQGEDVHHVHLPALPATRVARTGSGLHLIYQAPSSVLRNHVRCVGLDGIDLRGEGGYIVVAPSLHPNGRRYSWSQDMAPAPFPSRLLALLQQSERFRRREAVHSRQVGQINSLKHPLRSQQNPEYWLEKAVQHACVGKRHTCALWLSCRLVEHAHLTYQQAEPYLRRYVELVPGGDESYPLSDALNCLHWAIAHLAS